MLVTCSVSPAYIVVLSLFILRLVTLCFTVILHVTYISSDRANFITASPGALAVMVAFVLSDELTDTEATLVFDDVHAIL